MKGQFVATLKDEFGGKATNKQMLTRLACDVKDYEDVKAELVKAGVIKKARGRGGSVVLTGFEIVGEVQPVQEFE